MFFGLPSRNLRLVYHNFKARFHIAGNCLDCYNHDLSNQQWNMLTKGWADWRYSETTNLVMVWFLVTANEVKKYVEHHGDLVWVSNFLSANDDMYYNCLDIYYYLLLEMFHSDYEQFTQFNDVRFRVVSTCIESFEHWMKHHEAPRKFDDSTRSDCRKKMKPEMFFGKRGAPFLGNTKKQHIKTVQLFYQFILLVATCQTHMFVPCVHSNHISWPVHLIWRRIDYLIIGWVLEHFTLLLFMGISDHVYIYIYVCIYIIYTYTVYMYI